MKVVCRVCVACRCKMMLWVSELGPVHRHRQNHTLRTVHTPNYRTYRKTLFLSLHRHLGNHAQLHPHNCTASTWTLDRIPYFLLQYYGLPCLPVQPSSTMFSSPLLHVLFTIVFQASDVSPLPESLRVNGICWEDSHSFMF